MIVLKRSASPTIGTHRWQLLHRLLTSTLAVMCSVMAVADQPTFLGRVPVAVPLGDPVFDALRGRLETGPTAAGHRDFLRPIPGNAAEASELALSAARLTRIQLRGESATPRVALRSASPQERESSQPAPPPLFRLSRVALPLLTETLVTETLLTGPLAPTVESEHQIHSPGGDWVAGNPGRRAASPNAPLQGPAVGGFAGYPFRSRTD